MVLQNDSLIGPYRIVAPLGKGGMATVYKAYHERLDRHVAIKVLHAAFLQDETFLARFQREARIVAKLEHPNIVPIYDFSEHEGNPYLVMKFIDGPTLKQRAVKVGYTAQEIYTTLLPIAEALDYAHKQGILHRDLKPSNIMLDQQGQPYLTDFGLARIAQVGESTLSHDVMLGTPFYISPEQAQGFKDLSVATDIYSLGVVLYELLTGSVPFSGDTPYVIVHGHIYKRPTNPSQLNPDLPRAIDDVIERALAKDPANRHESAIELMRAYAAALGQPAPAPRSLPPQHADEPRPAPAPVISAPPQPPSPPAPPLPPSLADLPKLPKAKIKWGEREYDLQELGEKFKSGVYQLAEQIEEHIDIGISTRQGVANDPTEEARRKVRKQLKAREELVQHLFWFILVNGFLFVIWLMSGSGFPWFIFPFLGWGLGIAGHASDYYSKYGAGAQRREAEFERKVEEELLRSGVYASSGKAKNVAKAKNDEQAEGDWKRLADGARSDAPRVRLSADGELTDSFIDDAYKQLR